MVTVAIIEAGGYKFLDGLSSDYIVIESGRKDDYISFLSKLRILAFNECGNIPSLDFIKKLNKLEECVFMGTNIVDGDLSPCIGLKYVAFNNKKHYSHKEEDFNI